ncbi:TetR family transcriptional regulator [Streptomyces roseirectus]|uniref:TetR family transcriptional regulator n=1 Tax=Streptomyces roseirectus TaxID=2768066 RepID=A0A7H0I872_9ACTN|nr:TetR/AcrR family transcriptional regulator [Streptomyces roseirectus]QNP68988.1 TetR family transcriptional regulator [Streptomyces roseirectus]
MANEGLRERSKARRREAILRAAYQLFAEQGFEVTTIAEVAERAEVSARTVTLYFPSKLDLALDRFTSMADRLAQVLRERRPGRLAVDALEDWVRDKLADPDELDDLSDRMFDLNPQLKAVANARLADVVEEGARLLAQERGADPGDFGPRMAAAAAAAVISELCHRPEAADIDTAMRFLRAGLATLPEPGEG